MDAPARTRWRWAWFCPRCGAHNPAAAEACQECALEHALLNAPGPTITHACGVASPGWAAYCIGCGEELADEAAESEESPAPPPRQRTADPSASSGQALPKRPSRPHKILPSKDGPVDGLTLTRHVLLERSGDRLVWPEWTRIVTIVVLVGLVVGLMLRALAMPGGEALAFVREHRVPGRFDALPLLEGLHRLLAPSTPAAPAWTLRVERVELAPAAAGQPRLLAVRLHLRNAGTAAGALKPADLRLTGANGLDLPASESSSALARAAGLTPLGESVPTGSERTTLVVFELTADARDTRLKAPGTEVALPLPST